MTPAARLQAAIEILDQVLAGMAAEQALTGWARRSRFAGSKDRAAVRDHVFHALRNRNSHADLGGAMTGRGLVLGGVRAGGADPDSLFTGIGHAPKELNQEERDHIPSGPTVVDLPDWLRNEFQSSLGETAGVVEKRLRSRAPVFLRVNLRKTSVDQAIVALSADGIEAEPHSSAATALIVRNGDRRIRNSEAFRSGCVELQDGASQAVTEALPLRNGLKVLDYCAGGGGKSLAMAARADLTVVAHDVAAARMRDIPERANRAGVHVDISGTEELEARGPFDLILCDVPCSGSGSWRRAPDAKWRLTPERFSELTEIQREILSQVPGLICRGGILAYATCSVLGPENGDQISRFLKKNAGWQLLEQKQWLLEDQTDGFFLALLKAPD